MPKMKNKTYLAPALFIITFCIYLYCLMPGTGYSGDSAKFQYSSRVMGVVHTPGYPAYSLISHIFYLSGLGSVGFRINLMSAFFASVTVVLVYFIILQLIKSRPISFFSSLFFAVSRTFWSQAEVAEVYTLNAAFVAGVILLLLLWAEKRGIKYFYLAGFVYAMSFGHHLTVLFLAPAMLYLVLAADHKTLLNAKHLAVLAGFFILAALQYAYVFMRTYSQAAYVEMWTYDLGDFLWWVAGGQFKNKMFSSGITGFIKDRVPFYIVHLKSQFHFTGLVLGLAGACILARDRLKQAVFLLLIFFGTLFFPLNYNIGDVYVYFIPSFIIFAVFIAAGINALYGVIKNAPKIPGWLKTGVFYLFPVILCAVIFGSNFFLANQKDNLWSDEFSDIIVDNVKNDSVLLAPNYAWGQFYLYKLIGQKKRAGDGIIAHWYWHPCMLKAFSSRCADEPGAKEFMDSFGDRDKTVRSGFVFNGEIPAEKKVYFQKLSRKVLDRAGLKSRKVISIDKHGHKLELYELGETKEKTDTGCSINISDVPARLDTAAREVRAFLREGRLDLDFSGGKRMFLGGGWSRTEYGEEDFTFCWSDDIKSALRLPVEEPADHLMKIKARPVVYGGCPEQSMKVYVNGLCLEEVLMKNEWHIYKIKIPAKFLKKGENSVEFVYKYTASPIEVLGQEDSRDLSVSFAYISISK